MSSISLEIGDRVEFIKDFDRPRSTSGIKFNPPRGYRGNVKIGGRFSFKLDNWYRGYALFEGVRSEYNFWYSEVKFLRPINEKSEIRERK